MAYHLAVCPLLTLLLFALAATGCDLHDKCLSLVPETFAPNSSRTVLEYVSAGTNLTFPDNDPTCNRSSQVVSVDLCRVGLSVPTSNRSSVSLELWLPTDWNGRFVATGNGGVDGCELIA